MSYIFPVILLSVMAMALFKRVPVFECFLRGAKSGLTVLLEITPVIVGFVAMIEVMKASGLFDVFSSLIAPAADFLGFPKEIVPMALLRPVSGGGSTALLSDLLSQHGPDSLIGRITSVMSGSTETTFYAIAVYYGSVGVSKTRHTLLCALLADFTAACLAVVTVKLLMY